MTTVGALVTHLTARTKPFEAGLQRAERRTKAFQSHVAKLGVAIGAAFSVRAVTRFATESVKAFQVQEAAVANLSAALGGRGVEAAQRFASEMQRLTVIGDEALLKAMRPLATIGGLRDKQLERATKAAIGLSEVIDKDLNTAMLLMARAAAGDTAQLKRYGIVINETLSPQAKLNELIRMGNEGFALATARAQTQQGRIQQLSNAWGDLRERIGGFIARPLTPMLQYWADLTTNQDAATASAVRFADAIGLGIPYLTSSVRAIDKLREVTASYEAQLVALRKVTTAAPMFSGTVTAMRHKVIELESARAAKFAEQQSARAQLQAAGVPLESKRYQAFIARQQGVLATFDRDIAAAQNAVIEAQQALQRQVDRTTQSIETQIKTFGQGATAAQIEMLRLAGATETQLKPLEMAAAKLEAMRAVDELMRNARSALATRTAEVAAAVRFPTFELADFSQARQRHFRQVDLSRESFGLNRPTRDQPMTQRQFDEFQRRLFDVFTGQIGVKMNWN
jgi:hypothetical protein